MHRSSSTQHLPPSATCTSPNESRTIDQQSLIIVTLICKKKIKHHAYMYTYMNFVHATCKHIYTSTIGLATWTCTSPSPLTHISTIASVVDLTRSQYRWIRRPCIGVGYTEGKRHPMSIVFGQNPSYMVPWSQTEDWIHTQCCMPWPWWIRPACLYIPTMIQELLHE
jgi:hypothetical protein